MLSFLASVVVIAVLLVCGLQILGFAPGGILMNSFGASFMSVSAPVSKGGLVATLQSMGALGLASSLLWGLALIIALACCCL